MQSIFRLTARRSSFPRVYFRLAGAVPRNRPRLEAPNVVAESLELGVQRPVEKYGDHDVDCTHHCDDEYLFHLHPPARVVVPRMIHSIGVDGDGVGFTPDAAGVSGGRGRRRRERVEHRRLSARLAAARRRGS